MYTHTVMFAGINNSNTFSHHSILCNFFERNSITYVAHLLYITLYTLKYLYVCCIYYPYV